MSVGEVASVLCEATGARARNAAKISAPVGRGPVMSPPERRELRLDSASVMARITRGRVAPFLQLL
jgi:hypothetical protein